MYKSDWLLVLALAIFTITAFAIGMRVADKESLHDEHITNGEIRNAVR